MGKNAIILAVLGFLGYNWVKKQSLTADNLDFSIEGNPKFGFSMDTQTFAIKIKWKVQNPEDQTLNIDRIEGQIIHEGTKLFDFDIPGPLQIKPGVNYILSNFKATGQAIITKLLSMLSGQTKLTDMVTIKGTAYMAKGNITVPFEEQKELVTG